MYTLLGLNLLRLLSQSKIAEFHMELELIDLQEVIANRFIQYPVLLEQFLMEGNYSKVFASRNEVPDKDYLFFLEVLIATIRNEVADCAEKAYEFLPIRDAAAMMYFNDLKEFAEFIKARDWVTDASQTRILFSKALESEKKPNIPARTAVSMMLSYAREMERIV